MTGVRSNMQERGSGGSVWIGLLSGTLLSIVMWGSILLVATVLFSG